MEILMKRSLRLEMVFGMMAALAGCGVDSADRPVSAVGRYQITPGDSGAVWLLDTTNGHLWLHDKNPGWGDIGILPASPK
jgi:hypothetical protein